MSETILLSNGAGDSASVALFGAELCAWKAKGVDLIWEIDPRFWDRTAPVLFPLVGCTRNDCVRVEGESYPLSLHGFAWEKDFAVAERREISCAWSSKPTRKRARSILSSSVSASNSASRPARSKTRSSSRTQAQSPCPTPAACTRPSAGRSPARRRRIASCFDAPEAPSFPSSVPAASSAPSEARSAGGPRLAARAGTLRKRRDGVLDMKSRRVAFDNGAGARIDCDSPTSRISASGRCHRPLFCLEPWTGHADPRVSTGELAKSRRCGCSIRARARGTGGFSL